MKYRTYFCMEQQTNLWQRFNQQLNQVEKITVQLWKDCEPNQQQQSMYGIEDNWRMKVTIIITLYEVSTETNVF